MGKRMRPGVLLLRVLLGAFVVAALFPAAAFADVVFSGTVLDVNGAPAEGWTVMLEDWSTEPPGQVVTTTDVDGQYSVTGLTDDADYWLWVADTSDPTLAAYYAERLFTAQPAGAVTVDFDFSPALSGTVTNAANGQPIAGAAVTAFFLDSQSGDWTAAAWTESAADGNYFISEANLQPGVSSYRVQFDALGYVSEYYNNKTTIATADALNYTGTAIEDINGSLTPQPVKRIAGLTRYSTSVQIGRDFVNGDWTGVVDVILASGEDRAAADPLSAAGLSWVYGNCPVFLTASNAVSSEVKSEIRAMSLANPGMQINLHVVGGTTSVPEARVNEIKSFVGAGKVVSDRVNGANRYDVSRLIAEKVRLSWANDFENPLPVPGVLIANGSDPAKFFDALAMSAVSAGNGMPILLVQANAVPSATKAELTALNVPLADTYIAGGTATVTEGVRRSIGVPVGNRLAGANRFSTARVIADRGLAEGWFDASFVGVAAKLPDALAGGAEVGALGGPLLLTRSDALPGETAGYISAHKATLAQILVFGGEASVRPSVISQIAAARQ